MMICVNVSGQGGRGRAQGKVPELRAKFLSRRSLGEGGWNTACCSSDSVIHDLWYKNAIIYCLNVETFIDSNGDGVGDFVGLTDKLAYLAGLGVTCIWLMPFYSSPNRDDGYDVSDYYGVHPRTGTFGDVVEFMNQRAAARTARHRRPRRQSHVGSSTRGSRRRGGIPTSPYRQLLRLVEEAAAQLEQGDGLSRRAERDVDARPGRAGVLLPPLLRVPAGSEHAQPRRQGRDDADHGVLAAARRLGVPHGRGAVPDRAQGRGRAAVRASTSCSTRCATSCSGGAATRIMLAEANVPPQREPALLRRAPATGCR